MNKVLWQLSALMWTPSDIAERAANGEEINSRLDNKNRNSAGTVNKRLSRIKSNLVTGKKQQLLVDIWYDFLNFKTNKFQLLLEIHLKSHTFL